MKKNAILKNPKKIIKYLLLMIVILWSFFPIFFIINAAFQSPRVIFSYPPRLFHRFNLDNFAMLFENWPGYLESLLNSLIISISAAVLTVLVSMPAGYVLSRNKGKVMRGSLFVLVASRMFPPIVLSVPLFPVFHRIGIIDHQLALIILYTTFFVSLGTLLMKTFIDEVPIELEESAKIDGASNFQIFYKIIVPLSLQGAISVLVFVFIFSWKEFTFAYIFTATEARTAPIFIDEMLGAVLGVEWGPLFAAATLQLIPALIFIYLTQNYLIKGIKAGSVKG